MAALAGKVALVTGASRGIGAAIARELAGAGALTALVGRHGERLRAALAGVSDRSRGLALPCDLTADEEIDGLLPAVLGHFGRLDILVHSAGIVRHAPIESAPIPDFDAQVAANVRSPFRLTQLALPHLKAAHGQIVFVNSSIVRAPAAGRSMFAATQHALRALADSLREEVNESGVRVTSVFPGQTATPRQAALHAQAGKPYRPERLIQPRDVAAMVVQALALPRTAEITEIHMRSMLPP